MKKIKQQPHKWCIKLKTVITTNPDGSISIKTELAEWEDPIC